MLKEWRLAYPRPILADGKREAHKPTHPVFPNSQGRPHHLGNIMRDGLWPSWRATGIVKLDDDGKPITHCDGTPKAKYQGLHNLRHWNASWLIARKRDGGLELPPVMVQRRLGHATRALSAKVGTGFAFESATKQELRACSANRFSLIRLYPDDPRHLHAPISEREP